MIYVDWGYAIGLFVIASYAAYLAVKRRRLVALVHRHRDENEELFHS
jgi:hypothetical protein